MHRESLKKFFAFVFTFILLLSSSFTPARAEDPSITFTNNPVYMRNGTTATTSFTVTGDAEVTFGEPAVYVTNGDKMLELTCTQSGNELTITANEGCGHGLISVMLNGSYYCEVEVNVYDDSKGFTLHEIQDDNVPITYGLASIWASVEPIEAGYMPANVKSSDPTVAEPEKPVMPVSDLSFKLNKPGTTKITVTAGKQSQSFNLRVLPEGDYADEVQIENDQYTFYLKVGESMKIPAKMVSYTGTCKDDELSYSIESQSTESGVITLSADGTVKAKNTGTAYVTVRSLLRREAYVRIEVYSEPTSISFSRDVYYLNQKNEWIYDPWPIIQPGDADNAPLVYTSSNNNIIKVTQNEYGDVNYEYVKPGEVTVRVAVRDNPKIYGEFKAVAINADYPDKIKAQSSIVLYPNFEGSVPVEFTPFASLHEYTGNGMADDSIALITGVGPEVIYVGGIKPGKTTMTIQAGPKAIAKVNVEVKSGTPKSFNIYTAALSQDNQAEPAYADITDDFKFVAGKTYVVDIGKVYENDLVYMGVEDAIGVDAAANLEKSGLFEVISKAVGPAYCTLWVKPLKAGTASVELIKGEKKKLTVIADAPVSMHRLYNPNSGEHFYTAKAKEKDALVKVGWKYEGIGWTAPPVSKTPVYRLYNANAGDHHYTMKAGERDALIKVGWDYEGIGWYSDDNKTVPLYRQYNPNAVSGSHNYTTNKKENDALVKIGWIAEGIGWYGIK